MELSTWWTILLSRKIVGYVFFQLRPISVESWDEKLKSLSPEMEEKLRGKIEIGQPVTIFIPKSMISRVRLIFLILMQFKE